MSILDDAIREHLELKRSHGADEAELKRLEDEAFGPAERPDQASDQVDRFAEAPTEFLSAPEATPGDPPPGGRRMPNVADLQEPPPARPVEPEENAADAATEGPSEEEHPAMEHQTIAEPATGERPEPHGDPLRPSDEPAPQDEAPRPDPQAPGASERPVVADQPTELFDVEGQFGEPAVSASPSDEELLDAERAEPRIAPADPLAELEDSGAELEVSGPAHDEHTDEFDEFFSEQRLSDELNQALEAPLPDEPGAPATDEAASPFLDPDTELREEDSREHGLPPDSREHDLPEDSAELELPEDSREQDLPAAPRDDSPRDQGDAADDFKPVEPDHVDALEDTPEFLEESPEDDDAWFEQRPPKDFDFGD